MSRVLFQAGRLDGLRSVRTAGHAIKNRYSLVARESVCSNGDIDEAGRGRADGRAAAKLKRAASTGASAAELECATPGAGVLGVDVPRL